MTRVLCCNAHHYEGCADGDDPGCCPINPRPVPPPARRPT